MPSFQAAGAVEPLEYDFTQYVPDAKGVIPEPTTGQIQDYFNSAREMAKEVQGIRAQADRVQAADGDADAFSEEEIAEIVDQMENLDIGEYTGKVVTMVAALCSDQPNADQINALPFRVRQAFVKWVSAQFRS